MIGGVLDLEHVFIKLSAGVGYAMSHTSAAGVLFISWGGAAAFDIR